MCWIPIKYLLLSIYKPLFCFLLVRIRWKSSTFPSLSLSNLPQNLLWAQTPLDFFFSSPISAMYQPRSQVFVNHIAYSLIALGCSLFFSYPYWFPSVVFHQPFSLFLSPKYMVFLLQSQVLVPSRKHHHSLPHWRMETFGLTVSDCRDLGRVCWKEWRF